MSENRTSEVVAKYLLTKELPRGRTFDALSYDEEIAMCEKYQRNDDKLRSLMFFLLSHSQEGITGDECYDHATQIQDVLLFDPLFLSQDDN